MEPEVRCIEKEPMGCYNAEVPEGRCIGKEPVEPCSLEEQLES